ncbi:hypothetical protein Trydic_g2884 [Trypoxylus dichotomus]
MNRGRPKVTILKNLGQYNCTRCINKESIPEICFNTVKEAETVLASPEVQLIGISLIDLSYRQRCSFHVHLTKILVSNLPLVKYHDYALQLLAQGNPRATAALILPNWVLTADKAIAHVPHKGLGVQGRTSENGTFEIEVSSNLIL